MVHGDDEPVGNDRLACKHDDKGQEIKRERKNPKERYRRHIR